MKGRAQTTGKKFSELKFGKVPVTIVFTKEDEKRLEIRQALISQGTAPTDENVEIAFGKEVKRQRKEIRDLAEQSFVSVGSSKCSACSTNIQDPIADCSASTKASNRAGIFSRSHFRASKINEFRLPK